MQKKSFLSLLLCVSLGACQAGTKEALTTDSLSLDGLDSWHIGMSDDTRQLLPIETNDPLTLVDGEVVAHVRLDVGFWGEVSLPINGFDATGEAAVVDLSGSKFVEVTYQSNQEVKLQLRHYAVHKGIHNHVVLPKAKQVTTKRIPYSEFSGGLKELNLANVAKFNFALLSNNKEDGYIDLVVQELKIDGYN